MNGCARVCVRTDVKELEIVYNDRMRVCVDVGVCVCIRICVYEFVCVRLCAY